MSTPIKFPLISSPSFNEGVQSSRKFNEGAVSTARKLTAVVLSVLTGLCSFLFLPFPAALSISLAGLMLYSTLCCIENGPNRFASPLRLSRPPLFVRMRDSFDRFRGGIRSVFHPLPARHTLPRTSSVAGFSSGNGHISHFRNVVDLNSGPTPFHRTNSAPAGRHGVGGGHAPILYDHSSSSSSSCSSSSSRATFSPLRQTSLPLQRHSVGGGHGASPRPSASDDTIQNVRVQLRHNHQRLRQGDEQKCNILQRE